MKRRRLKIEGKPNLEKDPVSSCIVNTNDHEYKLAKRRKEAINNRNKKIDNQEKELDELKEKVNNLTQMVNKVLESK